MLHLRCLTDSWIRLWMSYFHSKWFTQKQPSRYVPRKGCSKNMQQIYKRAPMPKCDFNKETIQLRNNLLAFVLRSIKNCTKVKLTRKLYTRFLQVKTCLQPAIKALVRGVKPSGSHKNNRMTTVLSLWYLYSCMFHFVTCIIFSLGKVKRSLIIPATLLLNLNIF